jgi:glycogen debranching enzyme
MRHRVSRRPRAGEPAAGESPGNHPYAPVGAAGFSRYGFRDLVVRLLESMKDASTTVDMRRLPELVCGFPRRPGEGPTQYPVACAPQAWAAGSVFMLLSAALGLTVDGCANEITLSRPILPPTVPVLRVSAALADWSETLKFESPTMERFWSVVQT